MTPDRILIGRQNYTAKKGCDSVNECFNKKFISNFVREDFMKDIDIQRKPILTIFFYGNY